jgi:hypothetical protein
MAAVQDMYLNENVKVSLQLNKKSCTVELRWPDKEVHSLDMTFLRTLFSPVCTCAPLAVRHGVLPSQLACRRLLLIPAHTVARSCPPFIWLAGSCQGV